MKILITGATGFIGEYVADKLLSEGHSLRLLIRTENNLKDKYKNKSNVDVWIGDLNNPESISGINEEIEAVFHLAAMGHVSSVTEESYRAFTSINVEGSRNLINQFINSTTLVKFVHFSSTAAMGFQTKKGLVNEEDKPNPVTPYQKCKLDSEKVVLEYYNKHNFPAVIIRPCMVYGVGGKGEFLKIAKLIKKGVFPKVGLGQNLTPIVHVKDVANGSILAMRNGRPGQIYLIASETSFSMDFLRKNISQSIGKKSLYLFYPKWLILPIVKIYEKFTGMIGKEPIVSYQNILSTITDRTFDIAKTKEELQYKPLVEITNGIEETISWFKEEGYL